MKILIIEDEQALLTELKQFLEEQDFLCETAATYSDAEDKLAFYEYDAIVLDITLPGGSGLDLLRKLKKENPETGVLIISARDSLDDKLQGLDLGADDYITKPFHFAELNARIHALLRRRNFQGRETMDFHEISVDIQARQVHVNGQPVELTRKEYALLIYFLINKNRVLSKQAIAEHLWGDHYDLADRLEFIYVHINNLRKKLQASGSPDYIKTIYGMGYKFTA